MFFPGFFFRLSEIQKSVGNFEAALRGRGADSALRPRLSALVRSPISPRDNTATGGEEIFQRSRAPRFEGF